MNRSNLFYKHDRIVLSIFLILFTLMNLPIFFIGTLQVNQIAFFLFISYVFCQIKRVSIVGVLALSLFGLLLLIGSFLGHDSSTWFFGDLIKMMLLGLGVFVYYHFLCSVERYSFYINTAVIVFLSSSILLLPFNVDLILSDHRLIIMNFGCGAEDLGWMAATLLVLFDISVSFKKKITRTDHFLLIGLMLVVIGSLSRDAMLFVLSYAVLSRRLYLFTESLIAAIIAAFVYYFLVFCGAIPLNFLDVNAYRFMPGSGGPILTGRALIWTTFWRNFLHGSFAHQVFGYGIGSISLHIPEVGYYSRDPHNLYLDILNNFGLFGCIVFLIFFMLMLPKFLSKNNRKGIAIFFALLVAAFFNSIWRFSGVIWLNALVFVMPVLYCRLIRENKRQNVKL